MEQELDPQVVALARAIRQRESGGNFDAVGDNGTSHGAYQWQEPTWKAQAKKILGNENAPKTRENQQAVAYFSIKELKDQGKNPAQIAAIWNSGSDKGWEKKVGTTVINGKPIKYDVPAYVKQVTDYYQQYKNESVPTTNPEIPPTNDTTSPQYQSEGLGGFATGVGQGLVKTFKGLENLGNTILNPIKNAVGLGDVQTGNPELYTEKANTILEPTTTSEKAGNITEQIAEFLLPSSGVAKAEKVATGLIKGTGILSKGAQLGTKALIEGSIGAGQAALKGGNSDDIKTTAIISAMFPVAGAVVGGALKGAGNLIGATGKKIQQSVIKPSIADVKDGFKVENLSKYNLGGTLSQTLAKTNVKINQLSQELKDGLKGATIPLKLNEVYEKTLQRLTGDKLGNFGNNAGMKRVLENLKSEITEVAGNNGLVDLTEAQLVKRGAGTKGAWVFGSADPDATSVEKVYNTFYNELKTEIEKVADKTGFTKVKEINKQISELIPISNAVLRRIPVAERNNVIGLTDGMALYSALFDPKALAILGVTKLAKSGRFGEFLAKAGQSLKSSPTSSIGKRALGEPVISPNR